MSMDAKGRCCGRKPILYKSGLRTSSKCPHFFCTRCDSSYDATTREQIENWAFVKDERGQFVRRRRVDIPPKDAA